MITFAALVVVSDYALTINHVRKPILVSVPRWRKRFVKEPDHILRKTTFVVCDSLVEN